MEKYDVPFVYKDGEEGFEMAQDRGYTTSSEVVVPDVYWAMVNGRKKKIYLKYNSRKELATHYEEVHKIVKGGQWKCCRRCNNIFHKKVEFHICIASDDQLKEEFRKRKEVTKDDGSEKEEEITKDDGCEKEEEPEDWMNIESEEELEEKVKSESVEFHICIASDDQLKITKDDGSEEEEEIMKDDGCEEEEEEPEDKMKSESEEEREEKVKSGSED